jgi:signal transduction histidine kinase/ActR/RegA family two-component response regulator
MADWILSLFSSNGFMPHGMCYLWQPGILTLHVLSDSLITLAYFSIPFTLLYFVRRRRDLQFNWMFVCFAVFIVACGATHLLEVLTIWHPVYWLSGGVKAITALASVPTAILLVRLIPDALRLPSPSALQRANTELALEVAERKRAEGEVRLANEALESRVAERTRELESAYQNLRQSQQAILQQERLRALGQMASGIAHDINNALTPATLYAQSLLERDDKLNGEAREDLEVIQRAIEDVTETVARIKEFYRGREAQRGRVAFDVNPILAQVIGLTRARWSDMPQQRGAYIEVRCEPAESGSIVLGSESEVRDALTNLVLNAVDSMPEGGVLTLRSRVTPEHVTVEVGDTGVGMDEETRNRCLEPFFTTKGERGTGLGLAMVYGMTQRHSAVIEVDSEPGTGTTMRLIFPSAAGHVRGDDRRVPHRPRDGLRILIVDDDALLRRSLSDVLQRDGHQVSVADGGQSGIEAFARAQERGERFQVVITDLGMPHVDGRSVATAVKAASPQTPVVMLTGWGHQLRDESDMPSHVDRVLNKPPQLGELRAALSELTGPWG